MNAKELRARHRSRAVEEARVRARTARATWPPLTVRLVPPLGQCEVCRPSRVGRYVKAAVTGAALGVGSIVVAAAFVWWVA